MVYPRLGDEGYPRHFQQATGLATGLVTNWYQVVACLVALLVVYLQAAGEADTKALQPANGSLLWLTNIKQ